MENGQRLDEFKPHYEEGKSKKLLNLDCVRNPK